MDTSDPDIVFDNNGVCDHCKNFFDNTLPRWNEKLRDNSKLERILEKIKLDGEQKEFDCIIGQSDHTNDIKVPVYAAAAGAQILEKHFKIDEEFECVDASVSITEFQMNELIKNVRELELIFGNEKFGIREVEKNTVPFRRISK